MPRELAPMPLEPRRHARAHGARRRPDRRPRRPGLRFGAAWLTLFLVALSGGCDRLRSDAPGPSGARSGQQLPRNLLPDERNTIEVFRRTSPSVVFVRNSELRRSPFSLDVTEIPRGEGSGFVWDRNGHIVTNFHVIQGGNRFTISLADGSSREARLVGSAPRKDLAVLAIDPSGLKLVPLEAGDSTRLLVGQKVLAIGNPFGLDGSLSTGVISALGRDIRSVADTVIEDVIQTDASVNPGNSGGPLLDSSGRLIGVTTAIASTSGSSAGVAFAVPVATVSRIVPQLIEHGRVQWPGIGVTLVPDHVAARWGLEGVIVRSVIPGSPAARAGLQGLQTGPRGAVRTFDLITEVDGHPIRSASDLIDVLDDHAAGDVVKLRFKRGGETWEANVELALLD